MTIRAPFADHFRKNKEFIEREIQKQPENLDMVQLYFANYHDPEYEKLSLEDLRNIARTIVVNYSQNELNEIERLTQDQSDSKQWYRFRAGRVTASQFYKVCRTSLLKASVSLIERICWPEKFIFESKQTNHGKKNEPYARSDYVHKQKKSHSTLTCVQSGLVINNKYPFFGASPDGIIECECCGRGTLEIKCPYTMLRKTERGICVANEKIEALLKDTNGEYFLNAEHYYYFQLQMQIIICDVDYSDFFIWKSKNYHILSRVYRNEDFWLRNYPKAEQFVKEFLLPEMLGNYFSRNKIVRNKN